MPSSDSPDIDHPVHPSRPFRFCPYCAVGMELIVDTLDQCRRPVCPGCGYTHYEGPRLLVICILIHGTKSLMLKRATEPFADKWAYPGGFVDEFESPQRAAAREVHEEIGVSIEPDDLIPAGFSNVSHINQLYICYQLRLHRRPELSLGPEASDANWFESHETSSEGFWVPNSLEGVKQFHAMNHGQGYAFGVSDATENDFSVRLFKLDPQD